MQANRSFEFIDDLAILYFCLAHHADIDECKEKKACQCTECSCKNTWGSYECTCSGDLLYIRDQDTCIGELVDLGFAT